MRAKNLLVFSVLATVLLSSAFMSSATAQDMDDGSNNTSTDPSTLSESTDKSDELQDRTEQVDDAPDSNGTLISGNPDENLYTTQENSTEPQLTDFEEDANLIATQTSPDNTVVIATIAVLIAVIVGSAIGVIYYRKRA
jgi:hypothetical protein